jgi:hypothetical protein
MPQTLSRQSELPGLKLPDLEKLEDRVRKGLASFVDVGRALQQIEEKRGYLLRDYKDFTAYCEGEFHFSLRQGQRLMLAAETAQKVQKALGEMPRNEASARVLNPIAGDPKLLGKLKDRLAAQKLNVATATAEKLQEVVEKIKPKTAPMFDDKPRPIAAIAGLSDVCPACGKVPGAYTHDVDVDAWKCGSCHATVRVGALPLEIAVCKECGAPMIGDSGICERCGAVQ